MRITFWPMVLEGVTFVLTILYLFPWYYTWDSLARFKGVHLSLGLALVVVAQFQQSLIDVMAGYMLTPAPAENLLRVFFNATAIPLDMHRIVGDISFAGFVIAGYAAFRTLRARDPEHESYWDWVGGTGLIAGLGFLFLQPAIGLAYVEEIRAASPRRVFRDDAGASVVGLSCAKRLPQPAFLPQRVVRCLAGPEVRWAQSSSLEGAPHCGWPVWPATGAALRDWAESGPHVDQLGQSYRGDAAVETYCSGRAFSRLDLRSFHPPGLPSSEVALGIPVRAWKKEPVCPAFARRVGLSDDGRDGVYPPERSPAVLDLYERRVDDPERYPRLPTPTPASPSSRSSGTTPIAAPSPGPQESP